MLTVCCCDTLSASTPWSPDWTDKWRRKCGRLHPFWPSAESCVRLQMILWPRWGVGSPTFLVPPQQIKTQNGGYLSQGWEWIGGKKHWHLQESTSSSNILQTHGNSQVEYLLPFWCGRMSRPHHTCSLEWGLPFTLYWVRRINEEVGTCWTTMPRPDWMCLSVV